MRCIFCPTYSQDMREREYVKLIPPDELRPLRALLRKVCAARGWSGAEAGAYEGAWARVVEQAQQEPDGGGGGCWQLDFSPDDMAPSQLQRLCRLVEREFLGGLLERRVAQAGRPPLRVVMGRDPRDERGWLSGIGADNTIYVNGDAAKWRRSAVDGTSSGGGGPATSESNPLDFEGALCYSKLEVLAHTLGHELAHAVVLNFFPAIDRASPAYLPDDRHGPIFKLLNKRLFGHTTAASRNLFNHR